VISEPTREFLSSVARHVAKAPQQAAFKIAACVPVAQQRLLARDWVLLRRQPVKGSEVVDVRLEAPEWT
jgi:hypothetical protein